MKLSEYIFSNGRTNDVLQTATFNPSYMSEWTQHFGEYEQYFANLFGNVETCPYVIPDTTENTRQLLAMYNDGFFMSHNYEFSTLYKSTQFEYNPIQNYDGVERQTTTVTPNLTDTTAHSGIDTDTRAEKGEIVRERSGEIEHSETDPRTYTTTTPQHTETTTTESTTAEVSSDYYPVGKSQTITGEVAVTQGYDGSTAVNRDNYNGLKDVESYNNRQSVTELNHGETVTNTRTGESITVFELEKRGNIGVMTTQSMIQEERQVALFGFYRHIFGTWVAESCGGVYL